MYQTNLSGDDVVLIVLFLDEHLGGCLMRIEESGEAYRSFFRAGDDGFSEFLGLASHVSTSPRETDSLSFKEGKSSMFGHRVRLQPLRGRDYFLDFLQGSFRRCAFPENNRWSVASNIFDVQRREVRNRSPFVTTQDRNGRNRRAVGSSRLF
jgi:hypothetical protein